MKEDAGNSGPDGVALPSDRAVALQAEPVPVSSVPAAIPSALYTHHHFGWKRRKEQDSSDASLLSALLKTHGFLNEYAGKYRVEVKRTPDRSFDGIVTVYWDADEPKSFVFGAPRRRGDMWFRAFEFNVAPTSACQYCGGTGVDHYIGPFFHCWACDGSAVQVRQSTPRGFKHKRVTAQAIEARRAATTGAVHESAVRQDAPKGGPHADH